MEKFQLEGHAVFFAEDIDEAFKALSLHFSRLANEEDSDLFEPDTDIHLRTLDEVHREVVRE